jgi:hypothetical protein
MQDAVTVALETGTQVVRRLLEQAVASTGDPGCVGRQLGLVVTLTLLAV